MKTLIRIAEVWTPSDDGAALVLATGLFPDVPAFEAITRQMVFARGEGLPGRAWEAGHPLMLRQLVGSYFKRAAAARAMDLTCAVAVPVFQRSALRCVVVFLMGRSPSSGSAVRLWRTDSRLSQDFTLVDEHVGTNAQASAPMPSPEVAWAQRRSDTSGPKAFERNRIGWVNARADDGSRGAAPDAVRGIGQVLTLHCGTMACNDWVLVLQSAPGAPIALRTEVWHAHETDSNRLFRATGFCEANGALPAETEHTSHGAALGPIGKAWHTAVAQADAHLPAESGNTTLSAAGITALLALPVIVKGDVAEVLALYF